MEPVSMTVSSLWQESAEHISLINERQTAGVLGRQQEFTARVSRYLTYLTACKIRSAANLTSTSRTRTHAKSALN